jgi:probable phosphoglycerate mutase
MEKEFYLIRHGQTDFNKKGIIQGGGIDSSLNETGRAQAEAFHQYYKQVPFDLVVTSTLKRTRQTLEPFLDLGIEHYSTADINEISWGTNEGKSYNDIVRKTYQEVIGNWQQGEYEARFEGGESAAELGERVVRFVDYLKHTPAKKVLICSHGRTIRALICLLKSLELNQMEHVDHHNTGLFKGMYIPENFIFHLENDTSHLETLKIKM